MIPDVTLTLKDGALGLSPPASNNVLALIGTSSAGVVNAVNSFGAGNPQAIRDALGSGALVEEACSVNAAGVPVIAVRATSSGGVAGAVSQAGTGTSVMTITGTPLDAYDLKARIDVGAALPTSGLAQLSYSIDGGLTYVGPFALPLAGTFVVPNTGLTLNFAAGTLVAGDVYSSTVTAPTYDLTALNAALDALLADPREWFMVYPVGIPADVSAFAALFAAVGVKMDAAFAAFRYARAMINAPDVSDATLIPALVPLANTRVGIAAGFETVLSSITAARQKRPAGWTIAKRLGLIPPQQSAGRFASGPVGSEVVALLRDERVTPALDALGVSTMRTHVGAPGFYVTNSRLKAPAGSDFRYVEHGRVMDIACKATRVAFLQYLNDNVLVDPATGFILEKDAQSIERYATNIVNNATVREGMASAVEVIVDRTEPILSTETLRAEVRVTPLGYTRHISVVIGFFNPVLALSA